MEFIFISVWFLTFDKVNFSTVDIRANTIANFLRQPYPFYFNRSNLGGLTVGISLISFFFLYLFEPFHVNPQEHTMAYFWICVLHVAVSSLVFYCCFSLVNLLKIEEEKWTLAREIISLGLVLLLMGLANFGLRHLIYDNPNNWAMVYLLEEIRNTFLVGLLIIFILVPLNFTRVSGRNRRKAESLQSLASDQAPPPEGQVIIETQLKSDEFSLLLADFLFAKAEGNYVEFYLEQQGNIKRHLKRIPMKDLEAQLEKFPLIFKTHRSYLVNLQKVTGVSGNAQGYQLSFHQYPVPVPVSRGMIKKFDQAFARQAL